MSRLCLAHLGGDWEGLSEGVARWVKRGGWEEEEKKEGKGRGKERKGEDRLQVIDSMSTVDRSFVGRCVRCMCGP